MKHILLSVVTVLLLVAVKAQQPPPSASDILKEASLQAAREKKNVFVIFHASWCGWCKRMDKSMNDDACKKYFDDNFVIRHLVVDEAKDKKDLENPGANELKTKYNGEGQGIPFWLVFDKEGKLLADSKIKNDDGSGKSENTGCPASEKEVAYFIEVLKKTTSLKADQLEIIRKRFRENDQ
ncbi:MAG TPA: thioredoxin family protein [Chitinophagaceae bacterium]|jgi:thioredoxin-related protein|nr:thioredoxin family protein [Chitinophagaceae bacterium]